MNRRAILFCMVGAATAQAHSYRLGAIKIGHPWALPTAHGDGQAFMPLLNTGDSPDALVGARSSVCAAIELRRDNRYDDPPLDAMALEPGVPVAMRPTARHLRLIGLVRPLLDGDRFGLVLDFLNAGEFAIEVVAEWMT